MRDVEVDGFEVPNRVVRNVDYLAVGGSVYEVKRNPYEDKAMLKEVDEIPEEYFGKWDDE